MCFIFLTLITTLCLVLPNTSQAIETIRLPGEGIGIVEVKVPSNSLISVGQQVVQTGPGSHYYLAGLITGQNTLSVRTPDGTIVTQRVFIPENFSIEQIVSLEITPQKQSNLPGAQQIQALPVDEPEKHIHWTHGTWETRQVGPFHNPIFRIEVEKNTVRVAGYAFDQIGGSEGVFFQGFAPLNNGNIYQFIGQSYLLSDPNNRRNCIMRLVRHDNGQVTISVLTKHVGKDSIVLPLSRETRSPHLWRFYAGCSVRAIEDGSLSRIPYVGEAHKLAGDSYKRGDVGVLIAIPFANIGMVFWSRKVPTAGLSDVQKLHHWPAKMRGQLDLVDLGQLERVHTQSHLFLKKNAGSFGSAAGL